MPKNIDVYGVGNALVDFVIEVDDGFISKYEIDKGMMTLVDEQRQNEILNAIGSNSKLKQSGGSAANTMISISQFGGKSYYSFKVADDEFGRFYVEDLIKAGVLTDASRVRPVGSTGKCLVMVTPDAQRTMFTYLGITSNMSKDDLHPESLKDSKYLYLEGYLVSSEEGQEAMMEAKMAAQQNNVKTSLTFSDINMIKFFREGLEHVIGDGLDLIFGNEEEVMAYTETTNLSDAKEKMKTLARSFVITLGEKGAIIYDGKNFIDSHPYETVPVDTVGAGDMYAGGFLYGITSDHSYEESGHIASIAASKIVAKYGPRLEDHEPRQLLDQLRKSKKIKTRSVEAK
jgi:sugar/nucleoside kinase (ribokinase family)